MENQLRSFLQSSQDPAEVANKVKGVILASSAIIIFFAAQFLNIHLTANDIISLGSEFGMAAGAIWTIYGCVLHVVTWLGTVKAQQ